MYVNSLLQFELTKSQMNVREAAITRENIAQEIIKTLGRNSSPHWLLKTAVVILWLTEAMSCTGGKTILQTTNRIPTAGVF